MKTHTRKRIKTIYLKTFMENHKEVMFQQYQIVTFNLRLHVVNGYSFNNVYLFHNMAAQTDRKL